MRLTTLPLAFVVSIGLLAGPVSSQDIGPTGPMPYDIVEDWAKPFAGEGCAFGGNSGVYAESADRIIVLDDGHMVEQGDHQGLLARNGLYSQLVSTQLVGAAIGRPPGQNGPEHSNGHDHHPTATKPWHGLSGHGEHHH